MLIRRIVRSARFQKKGTEMGVASVEITDGYQECR